MPSTGTSDAALNDRMFLSFAFTACLCRDAQRSGKREAEAVLDGQKIWPLVGITQPLMDLTSNMGLEPTAFGESVPKTNALLESC